MDESPRKPGEWVRIGQSGPDSWGVWLWRRTHWANLVVGVTEVVARQQDAILNEVLEAAAAEAKG